MKKEWDDVKVMILDKLDRGGRSMSLNPVFDTIFVCVNPVDSAKMSAEIVRPCKDIFAPLAQT